MIHVVQHTVALLLLGVGFVAGKSAPYYANVAPATEVLISTPTSAAAPTGYRFGTPVATCKSASYIVGEVKSSAFSLGPACAVAETTQASSFVAKIVSGSCVWVRAMTGEAQAVLCQDDSVFVAGIYDVAVGVQTNGTQVPASKGNSGYGFFMTLLTSTDGAIQWLRGYNSQRLTPARLSAHATSKGHYVLTTAVELNNTAAPTASGAVALLVDAADGHIVGASFLPIRRVYFDDLLNVQDDSVMTVVGHTNALLAQCRNAVNSSLASNASTLFAASFQLNATVQQITLSMSSCAYYPITGVTFVFSHPLVAGTKSLLIAGNSSLELSGKTEAISAGNRGFVLSLDSTTLSLQWMTAITNVLLAAFISCPQPMSVCLVANMPIHVFNSSTITAFNLKSSDAPALVPFSFPSPPGTVVFALTESGASIQSSELVSLREEPQRMSIYDAASVTDNSFVMTGWERNLDVLANERVPASQAQTIIFTTLVLCARNCANEYRVPCTTENWSECGPCTSDLSPDENNVCRKTAVDESFFSGVFIQLSFGSLITLCIVAIVYYIYQFGVCSSLLDGFRSKTPSYSRVRTDPVEELEMLPSGSRSTPRIDQSQEDDEDEVIFDLQRSRPRSRAQSFSRGGHYD